MNTLSASSNQSLSEPKAKILVVDDDVRLRDLLRRYLTEQGFNVVSAENAQAMNKLWIRERYDMLVLDLMLPEIDGFKVLETVRANTDPAIANTPIIILSNLWSNKDILRTKALKVQAYMVKAYFTTEEILAKINDVLKGEVSS